MKAISLTQPWASLVALGRKTLETRSWSTSYRGRIAIHASKGWTRADREFAMDLIRADVLPWNRVGWGRPSRPFALPLGAVVATATLADVVPTGPDGHSDDVQDLIYNAPPNELEYGDFGPDRFAWVLRDVVRLPSPIAARGSRGLWEWNPPPSDVLNVPIPTLPELR